MTRYLVKYRKDFTLKHVVWNMSASRSKHLFLAFGMIPEFYRLSMSWRYGRNDSAANFTTENNKL
jgi:hypothetical protein